MTVMFLNIEPLYSAKWHGLWVSLVPMTIKLVYFEPEHEHERS